LFDSNYVWYGLTINADPNSGMSYWPIMYALPAGYDAYAFSTDGGQPMLPHAGGYALTEDAPMYTVQVYFINS
jgi:hypothetical protein